jgi:DNA mismatch repair protein MutS
MFGHDDAFSLLGGVFSAEQIDALIPAARRAIGGLLSYVKDTQKSDAAHLKPISRNESGAYMELDLNTIRNLELLSILSTGETKGSLLSVLDRTKTPMGRRLLRTWVLRPLLHPDPIKQRLAAVGELHSETVLRGELTRRLKHVADTERLLSRIAYKNASPRDLKLLASSIAAVREIKVLLQPVICPALRACAETDDLADIAELIDGSIQDAPPLLAREGGVFKAGVDAEVDRLRGLLDNSAEALIAIETNERERTGKKLKVGYNKVFGYYIEIPRASSEDVPGDYIRKQTLANAERFITQELKELESDLLSARDKLAAIELRMYNDLLDKLSLEAARIQETSRLVAVLDVYCSLAEAARTNNYACPDIDIGGTIDIKAGRHPTVERSRTDILFVPNDALLDWDSTRCVLLTGPNMAGKSTYMRQIALICIMAQIGSFVPAAAAHIGIIDRIFTRIGAQDDLSAGKSTFMVEMSEVADILNAATSRSLIVLDEVGRGTSTYDGMSVARAVLEYCALNLRAKTLFSTHYHELTALEGEIDGVRNFNISAKKQNDDIIFLRKIIPGPADESYGIEVAGLAGVPESVIARAKDVLKTLENGETSLPARKVEISTPEPSLAERSLKKINPDKLSPLEALNLLYELKSLADWDTHDQPEHPL